MNKLIISIVLSASYLQGYSQVTDLYGASSFEWSVPMTNDNGEVLEESIMYWVSFWGNYKNITEKYSDYRERGDFSMHIFHYENGKYLEISKQDMFNENLSKLLAAINREFKGRFLTYVKENPDCYAEEKFEPYTMNNLELYFTKDKISFSISRFGRSYNICETADDYEIAYTWAEILPYLKDQTTKTPNYCTPSGAKVNVRSDQSVKAAVNFQLDRGQFFEILETGKKDVVNGKDGSWYKINFEGKTGYIFSFYTLCK